MPQVAVTRTYLRLPAEATVPDRPAPPGVRLHHIDPCPVATARRLYSLVGADYHWRDRLDWSDDRFARHLAAPGVQLFVLTLDGDEAGYFELARASDGSVELAYFGLLPAAQGRGLGRWLLEQACLRARALGEGLWVHTCTLDGPAALPNYLARGFVPIRTEDYMVELPVA